VLIDPKVSVDIIIYGPYAPVPSLSLFARLGIFSPAAITNLNPMPSQSKCVSRQRDHHDAKVLIDTFVQ
jgi:hypothetical protein